MKERILLEKLKTRNGESSILIVLLASAIIIFVFLPIFSLMFDKAIVKVAIQRITDEIDLQMYRVYQYLDLDALSKKKLVLKGNMVYAANQALILEHPQIKEIAIDTIQIKERYLIMKFELTLNPTLYREVYTLDNSYAFEYIMEMPLNGE